MNPEKMQIAGIAMLRSGVSPMSTPAHQGALTDEELSLLVAALGCVLSFLKGAGYGDDALIPLQVRWEALQYQQQYQKNERTNAKCQTTSTS